MQVNKEICLTLQSLSASHLRAQSAHSLMEPCVLAFWGFPNFFFSLGQPSNTAEKDIMSSGYPETGSKHTLDNFDL